MIDVLASCDRCGAILAPWEKRGCSCSGPQRTGNAELLYALACRIDAPLHVRDYARLIERDYGCVLSEPTANATLAPDKRFCWAGKGLYCLYRHGPLPGPRNLEEAARLALVAADQPLTTDALDFVLKRLGYRYNPASLNNAINRSRHITWRHQDGRWEHPHSDVAERQLRAEIPTVPPRHRAPWQAMIERLAEHIRAALTDRESRLHDLGDLSRFGIDWDSDAAVSL